MKYKTVYSCRKYISEEAEQYDVHVGTVLFWVTVERMNWQDGVQPSNSLNLRIAVRTCELIIDKAIADSVRDKYTILDTSRTARKVWPRLDKGRTISLLKAQRRMLNMIVRVTTGHYIMGTHESALVLGTLIISIEASGIRKRRGLFFTSWVYVRHFAKREKVHRCLLYARSGGTVIDCHIDSLSRFIRSSERFRAFVV